MKIVLDSVDRYYKKFQALSNISFTLSTGDFLVLLGPNGAGKSTLIRLLCGLDHPDKGKLSIESNGSRKEVGTGTHIGYCPQGVMAWSDLSCREQLNFVGEMCGLTKKAAEKKSLELLNMFDLGDKINVLMRNLSGGMQHRLSICIALVSDPRILIFDEPYAGLDTYNQSIVTATFEKLRNLRKYIIVCSMHNISRAEELSDKVAIMDKGRLLAIGKAEELKEILPGKNVIELELDENKTGDGAKISELIGREMGCLHENRKQYYVEESKSNCLTKISTVFEREGILPKKVIFRETNLEDLFLHYTGRDMSNEDNINN